MPRETSAKKPGSKTQEHQRQPAQYDKQSTSQNREGKTTKEGRTSYSSNQDFEEGSHTSGRNANYASSEGRGSGKAMNYGSQDQGQQGRAAGKAMNYGSQDHAPSSQRSSGTYTSEGRSSGTMEKGSGRGSQDRDSSYTAERGTAERGSTKNNAFTPSDRGSQNFNRQSNANSFDKNTGANAYGSSAEAYEVDEDNQTHKWTVHPVARSGTDNAKWVVECSSRNEANTLKRDLVEGKIKPPTEAPKSYGTPRKHTNGKTMIYAKAS